MSKFKRKTRSNKWDDNTTYGYKGKPSGDNSVKDHISLKSMKDLPKSSYSLKSDPYTAALPTSEPYPIINKFNRTVGGHYAGEDNLDGGNVQQYANSTTSKFLKAFDELRLKINVNYRYLPIKEQTINDIVIGKQLVDEMRKSLAETVSILRSTTYTQMAINNFAIETDLCMGSAKQDPNSYRNIANGSQTIMAYTSQTDVLYAMSIYYQTFLQNALSVMNAHNSFRLKQGTAIRNAWNREVPNLNSFFGLMNKKAFLSLLDSINLSFEGEYIDKDFMEQMNLLTIMPSRRANSMMDPVLELQCGFNHPNTFRIYLLGDDGKIIDPDNKPFFDDADLSFSIMVNGVATETSVWQACDQLRNYLSLEATQNWARQTLQPAVITNSDTARYNQIKNYFDVLISSFTLFKPIWSDFREAFDVMARTGTINWTKGFRPSITKDTDAQLFQNLTVDHIYQMIMSGSNSLKYDEDTKRWRTFSLWNIYNGIPEYDTREGGSFLTFSFKNLDGIVSSEQIEYLPRLFNTVTDDTSSNNEVVCAALSRDGKEAIIKVNSININSNTVLSRLAPLASQASLEIRVPSVNHADNTSLTRDHFSMLYKCLTQAFGLCRIQAEVDGQFDYAIDPDILSIYQIELNDITNVAISYSRANAPFRGTTSNEGILGFAGLTK